MKKAKLLKAVVSAFAAVALAATTAIASFAANTPVNEGSIVINNSTPGHVYEAYQIFDGDMTQDEAGIYTLSNIKWGSGINTDGENFSAAVKAVVGEDVDVTNAAAVAEKITGSNVKAFASAIASYLKGTPVESTFADDKYTINISDPGYYLVKDKDSSLDGKDDAYTSYIVQVLGTVASINPKSDKPSVEKKVMDNEEYTDWNDVADYDIGEKVPFKLTATMPGSSDFNDYKTYSLKFTDTLSTGLTFNNDIKVTIDGTTVEASNYTVTQTNSGFTVEIADVKTLGATMNSKVVVEYTATLNANAVVGLGGNENAVKLEYSNNPNGEGKGETPEDKVVVFTYELDVNKIDGEDETKTLAGAEFKLSQGDKWLVVENGKVKEWIDDKANASTLITDGNGKISIIGLDEGTYSLEETKAPAGYNLPSNEFKLVITADDVHALSYDGSNAANLLTALKISVDGGKAVDGNTATGLVNATVKNNKGSSLPSTGGIGTTIFYVCGGIIVAAAAVLLIAKMRKREA